ADQAAGDNGVNVTFPCRNPMRVRTATLQLGEVFLLDEVIPAARTNPMGHREILIPAPDLGRLLVVAPGTNVRTFLLVNGQNGGRNEIHVMKGIGRRMAGMANGSPAKLSCRRRSRNGVFLVEYPPH